MRNEDRVRKALEIGQDTAQFLDGREHNPRYWINAKAALGKLVRQRDVAERERDALRGVIGDESDRQLMEMEC